MFTLIGFGVTASPVIPHLNREVGGFLFGFILGSFLFFAPFVLPPYCIWRWRKATKAFLEEKETLPLEQLWCRRWAFSAGLLLVFGVWVTYEAALPLSYSEAPLAIIIIILLFPLGPVQFGFMYRSLRVHKSVLPPLSSHDAKSEPYT